RRQGALRVDVELLAALFVLEPDLVEVVRRPAGRRPRLDAGLRLVGGQVVRRHVLAVVDATDDDRLIGIAFEEGDDDFLADARQVDHPPVLAGPALRDSDPARAVLVAMPFAVPVELHLHAPEVVNEDLLTGRPDHFGGLHAVDDRLPRAARRTQLHRGVDALEFVLVRHCARTAGSVALARAMVHAGQEVASIEGRSTVLALRAHRELEARGERSGVARAAKHDAGGVLLLLARAHEPVAAVARHRPGGEVVDLVSARVTA